MLAAAVPFGRATSLEKGMGRQIPPVDQAWLNGAVPPSGPNFAFSVRPSRLCKPVSVAPLHVFGDGIGASGVLRRGRPDLQDGDLVALALRHPEALAVEGED